MEQFPAHSKPVMEFSWWLVVAALGPWVLALGYYYRTFLTDVEKKRIEAKGQAARDRRRQARMNTIDTGMRQAILEARLGREAAEAAAAGATLAADGAAARRAAGEAEAAARKAEDSAIAAVATAKSVMTKHERTVFARTGRHAASVAEEDAAAARAASDRAAAAAAAKGAPVA